MSGYISCRHVAMVVFRMCVFAHCETDHHEAVEKPCLSCVPLTSKNVYLMSGLENVAGSGGVSAGGLGESFRIVDSSEGRGQDPEAEPSTSRTLDHAMAYRKARDVEAEGKESRKECAKHDADSTSREDIFITRTHSPCSC